MSKDVTNFEILEAMNAFAVSVDARFESIESRFDGIDGRFANIDSRFDKIESQMVTKDYLDQRLAKTEYSLKSYVDDKFWDLKAELSDMTDRRVRRHETQFHAV